MAGSELGLSVLIEFPFCAVEVAIAADNFLCLRVPHDELLVAVLAGVKLVEVQFFTCSSAGFSESYLAQSAYLAQCVGCVVGRYHVDFVVAFVRQAQLLVLCEFFLDEFLVDRWYDGLLLQLVSV